MRRRQPHAAAPLLAAAVLLQTTAFSATAAEPVRFSLAAVRGSTHFEPVEQLGAPRLLAPSTGPQATSADAPDSTRTLTPTFVQVAMAVAPASLLSQALPMGADESRTPRRPSDSGRRFADLFGRGAGDATPLRTGIHRFDVNRNASVYVEFGNEDKGVLQGLSKSAFGDDASDGSFSMSFHLAYGWARSSREHVSLSIEQHVFTPSGDNKRKPTAVDGDRPFAAYFGGAIGYLYSDGSSVHRFDLRLAIVGRMAGGSDMQNLLHKASGRAVTVWDDQVAPRGGAIVEYRPALRWRTGCRAVCAELASHLALVQGNLLAYEGLGATLRLGNRLDRDFGPPAFSQLARGAFVSDHRGFTWSIFAGEERRLQHRNYLLEGPTAVNGRRTVRMLRRSGDRQFGADLRFARTAVSVVLVRRAAEFEGHAAQQFVRFGIGGSY